MFMSWTAISTNPSKTWDREKEKKKKGRKRKRREAGVCVKVNKLELEQTQSNVGLIKEERDTEMGGRGCLWSKWFLKFGH